MFRKALVVVALALLSLGLATPTQAVNLVPQRTMSTNQIAWYGPYASDQVAYAAGNRIIDGLRAGFAVVYQPLDPAGRGRGGGWYVIVTYYQY